MQRGDVVTFIDRQGNAYGAMITASGEDGEVNLIYAGTVSERGVPAYNTGISERHCYKPYESPTLESLEAKTPILVVESSTTNVIDIGSNAPEGTTTEPTAPVPDTTAPVTDDQPTAQTEPAATTAETVTGD